MFDLYKGTRRISLKAKCLIKQKGKSKCQSGGQSGSPLGPLKKQQKHDKIHWRTDKIKKKVSKRQSFWMTK